LTFICHLGFVLYFNSNPMEETFTLTLPDRIIRGVLHFPENKNPGFVVTCHGLFSSMESEKFIALAKTFTDAGLAAVRFDFSGCGKSTGNISQTTVSKRIAELAAVVRFAENHPALGNRFGILGSSLGGFTALFYAAQHAVNALSVWATPYDLAEICCNIPDQDRNRLDRTFFDDAAAYHLTKILGNISNIQIIQGKKDLIVPWQHAQKIYAAVNEPKELIFFNNADHSVSEQADREKALEKSREWMIRRIS